MKKLTLLILTMIYPIFLVFGMPRVGMLIPQVTLEGDNGGRVTGEAWSSSELRGRIHCVFYVDPDESDINKEMEGILNKAEYPDEIFGTVAIINMGATWLPNFAISAKLKSAQKDYPTTIYVEDLNKLLVKKWNLHDNSYDTVVVGAEGKVIFVHSGVFSKKDIEEMISIIEANFPSN